MNMSMRIKLPATQFASRQGLSVPMLPSRVRLGCTHRQLARKVLAVQTEEKPTESKPEVAKFADSIGLPTDEGLFGFKPFPEVWVGRLAMMGFLTSVVEEFLTGRGTLQQIGFSTPNQSLLGAILLVFGGATLIGTVSTLTKATGGKLSLNDLERYRQFFGIVSDRELKDEADALKAKGDFTSPDSFKQIADAQLKGTPADEFLSMGPKAEAQADATAEKMKADMQATPAEKAGTSMSLQARADVLEQGFFDENAEWNYARNVELQNGRWAMIGFLACIIVEAATGRGIIGQVFLYLRAVGLLGEASGF